MFYHWKEEDEKPLEIFKLGQRCRGSQFCSLHLLVQLTKNLKMALMNNDIPDFTHRLLTEILDPFVRTLLKVEIHQSDCCTFISCRGFSTRPNTLYRYIYTVYIYISPFLLLIRLAVCSWESRRFICSPGRGVDANLNLISPLIYSALVMCFALTKISRRLGLLADSRWLWTSLLLSICWQPRWRPSTRLPSVALWVAHFWLILVRTNTR